MFESLHTISIGPLTVSMNMMMLIFSIAVGYGTVHMYLKRLDVKERTSFLDSLLTGIIIAVVIYKLWPFILEPGLLLSNPVNFIYFMGGPFAVYGAIGAAFIYLLIQSWRKKWSYPCWDSLFFGAIVSFFVYAVSIKDYGAPSPFAFGYTVDNTVFHPVNFYYSWLYLLLLVSSIVLVKIDVPFARSIFLLVGLVVGRLLILPFTT